MKSGKQFLEEVKDAVVRHGFRAFGNDLERSETLTIHDAIRLVLVGELDRSNPGDVAYWEWREIRPFLKEVWRSLNTAVGKLDPGEMSAVSWCARSSCTESDAVRLLDVAMEMMRLSPPSATRRPTPKGLLQSGKVVGSIAESLAVLHEARQVPYGDLIDVFLEALPDDSTDLSLLAAVDDAVELANADRTRTDNGTLVPREVVRAYQVQSRLSEEEDRGLSLIGFLRAEHELNNLAGLSDTALLKRLLAIAPEKSGTTFAKLADDISRGN